MFLLTSENREAAKNFFREALLESLAESGIQPNDEILDAAALAAWLGCTPDTVRELARSKKIPCAKPSKSYIFIRSEIMEWIKAHKQPVVN
jgi:excisionase family DNA binding protein